MENPEVVLPDFGLPEIPHVVSAWHSAVGQRVVEGDRLLEITAGDVTIELSAPASGTLIERCVDLDEPLEIGQILARIQPG
jgi:pyruvate/2-oxoglutarate dehydrogenase complex dihydrolipoamide acyltransferase (E2) component